MGCVFCLIKYSRFTSKPGKPVPDVVAASKPTALDIQQSSDELARDKIRDEMLTSMQRKQRFRADAETKSQQVCCNEIYLCQTCVNF